LWLQQKKSEKTSKLGTWWRETIGELKKVSWPTRKEAWRLTVMVIVVMVLTGAFLGILDWLFSRLIQLIIVA